MVSFTADLLKPSVGSDRLFIKKLNTLFSQILVNYFYSTYSQNKIISFEYASTPVAFKTWCGHQYRVGIIYPPPLVEIGLRWLPKHGVDTSPCPYAHRRAWTMLILPTNKTLTCKSFLHDLLFQLRDKD